MKKSFLMLLVATALAGCTKNEILLTDGNTVQIALCSYIDISEAATRVPFEGVISTSNTLEARVITSSLSDFTGTPYANGIMNFRGGVATNYAATGFSGTSTFPANNPVFLFGLYPKEWVYTSGGVADFTFTGKEDVMATGKIQTQKSDVESGKYKTLSFQHLLTRLEVKLSAAAPVISTLGNIKVIKLIGDKTEGTTAVNNKVGINNSVDPATATFSSAGATSMDFYGLSLSGTKKVYSDIAVSGYTLTSVPTFAAYSMVAPVIASVAGAEEYFLEITTSATANPVKRIAVDLTSSANTPFEGSTVGRSFIVSIYFKSNSDIAVDVEVAPWVEEGEWQGQIPVG